MSTSHSGDRRRRRSRSHSKQHALNRKYVRLPEMKLVGMLNTGDMVDFSYKNVRYEATLTRDGLLGVTDDPVHKRASGVRGSLAVYDKPSNWTNDCVDKYRRDRDITVACKTNPSGFERVTVRRLAKSLNTLRDEYMAENFIGGTTHVLRPEEIAALAQERGDALPAAKRIRREPPDEISAAAAVYSAFIVGGPCTVATLHAKGEVRGYKNIAVELEQTVQDLLHIAGVQERLIAHFLGANNEERVQAVQDGQRLLGLTAQNCERLENDRNLDAYAAERIRTIDEGNLLLPPQIDIADILAEVSKPPLQ